MMKMPIYLIFAFNYNGKIVIIVTNARKMEWMLSTSDYMKYKKLQRKLKYTIRGLVLVTISDTGI